MRSVLSLAFVCAVAFSSADVVAQGVTDETAPRAVRDSTYAARLAVERLAETIRHGKLEPDVYAEASVSRALAELAQAAATRSRERPHPDLGILWDFQMEVTNIGPVGSDSLHVEAQAFIATDGERGGPITFRLWKPAYRWRLVRDDGLAARLLELSLRLSGAERP